MYVSIPISVSLTVYTFVKFINQTSIFSQHEGGLKVCGEDTGRCGGEGEMGSRLGCRLFGVNVSQELDYLDNDEKDKRSEIRSKGPSEVYETHFVVCITFLYRFI